MIVVDDEYLVRMGIKETIEWKDHDVEIVGEASNGQAGLQLAIEMQPDIIITDIKMPILDGLELVKRIQALKLDCVVIILSGYKDFEYAKDSLENGAYSYLLKPIDNDELINKVKHAMNDLQEKRSKDLLYSHLQEELPSIKHNTFRNLITGEYESILKLKEKLNFYAFSITDSGSVIYAKVDQFSDVIRGNVSLKATQFLYSHLIHFLGTHEVYYREVHQDYLLILCNASSNVSEKICEEALKKYEIDNQTIISMGICDYDGLDTIKDAYLNAKQVIEDKLFPMINTVSNMNRTTHKYSPQIVDAMKYISQNYSRNITVKMVSDSLFVSESYLMHLFKDNINRTFNECLTDYRIMVAKQLLLSGKLKVYEIAELVGYNDSKYFSQIFRKKTGLSPSQYVENDVI